MQILKVFCYKDELLKVKFSALLLDFISDLWYVGRLCVNKLIVFFSSTGLNLDLSEAACNSFYFCLSLRPCFVIGETKTGQVTHPAYGRAKHIQLMGELKHSQS